VPDGTPDGTPEGEVTDGVLDVEVIDDPRAAAAALDPLRARILGVLRRPGSATTVATELGESRQKINYHLRSLERVGLVELVEERPRRGLTERVMRTAADSWIVSPAALGDLAAEPDTMDRLSSRYLIAVAGRLVGEVGELARAARRAGQPLATLTIDTEIRFADPDARAAFTAELADAITSLAARHHDESAPAGRWHRLIVAAHPRPTTAATTNPTEIPTPTPQEDDR
jgi:DNA-binding transcriptional ArsR family regulator